MVLFSLPFYTHHCNTRKQEIKDDFLIWNIPAIQKQVDWYQLETADWKLMICNIKPSESIIALVTLVCQINGAPVLPVVLIGCINFQNINVVYSTNDKNMHVSTF